jgi:predicted SAM-dependent methyltransferase
MKLNIEDLDLDDGSIQTAIVNHVLEHVNDGQAAQELYRVLSPGGIFICSVPLVEGWESTYQNPEVQTGPQRLLHYGQSDHARYFGRDFRQRMQAPGFEPATEITAEGGDAVKYGLVRGEKVFVFRKPS